MVSSLYCFSNTFFHRNVKNNGKSGSLPHFGILQSMLVLPLLVVRVICINILKHCYYLFLENLFNSSLFFSNCLLYTSQKGNTTNILLLFYWNKRNFISFSQNFCLNLIHHCVWNRHLTITVKSLEKLLKYRFFNRQYQFLYMYTQ